MACRLKADSGEMASEIVTSCPFPSKWHTFEY